MQKYLPALQAIAAIVAKMNPKPILGAIEIEYGRTVRLMVIAVAVIMAVLLLGYNVAGVLAWLGAN